MWSDPVRVVSESKSTPPHIDRKKDCFRAGGAAAIHHRIAMVALGSAAEHEAPRMLLRSRGVLKLDDCRLEIGQ